ncbi:MAG: hypothetical protein KY397_04675 [Gemmatimonadetes bacterium]|nr:hypothetical protein [Gemmatimonadota bacterium]
MRNARTIPPLLSILLLLACSNDTPAGADERGELARSVYLGETFELAVGQRARIGESGLVIGFRGVREDSRCPVDVDCVWSGDGAVALGVSIGRSATRTVTLHTDLEPRAAAVGDLVVRLVALAPEPVSTRRIDPGEYVATLVVERR